MLGKREGGQRENTATAFDYICYPLIIVIKRGRDKSQCTCEGSNWLLGFKDAITSWRSRHIRRWHSPISVGRRKITHRNEVNSNPEGRVHDCQPDFYNWCDYYYCNLNTTANHLLNWIFFLCMLGKGRTQRRMQISAPAVRLLKHEASREVIKASRGVIVFGSGTGGGWDGKVGARARQGKTALLMWSSLRVMLWVSKHCKPFATLKLKILHRTSWWTRQMVMLHPGIDNLNPTTSQKGTSFRSACRSSLCSQAFLLKDILSSKEATEDKQSEMWVISSPNHWILTISYPEIHKKSTKKQSQSYPPCLPVKRHLHAPQEIFYFQMPFWNWDHEQPYQHLHVLAVWGIPLSTGFNRNACYPSLGDSAQIFSRVSCSANLVWFQKFWLYHLFSVKSKQAKSLLKFGAPKFS